MLAICAFVHSIYNLLPIHPLDGGQALKEIVYTYLPSKKAEIMLRCCNGIVISLLIIICGIASIILKLGIWPLLILVNILYRNRITACNDSSEGLQ